MPSWLLHYIPIPVLVLLVLFPGFARKTQGVRTARAVAVVAVAVMMFPGQRAERTGLENPKRVDGWHPPPTAPPTRTKTHLPGSVGRSWGS